MTQELKLRRKWTFRAHGKQVVFIKKTLLKIDEKYTGF